MEETAHTNPNEPEGLDGSLQKSQNNKKPARVLKVEDALLYLDQVKMEFSDKPQIYNEFLDIMKNFKAQSINTPGVIERVKNLFKGYNKLILGFNTFLPEGEGYKIELTAEEQAFHYPGQDVSNLTSTGGPITKESSSNIPSSNNLGSSSMMPGIPMGLGLPTGPGAVDLTGTKNFLYHPTALGASHSVGGNKVTLNSTFGSAHGQPQPYGATPAFGMGLGAGGSMLGGGLPSQGGAAGMPPSATGGLTGMGLIPSMPQYSRHGHPLVVLDGSQPPQPQPLQAPQPAPQQQQPGQMQQAHAIHYVTKIRNRFSSEPDTYRSFLKILHTYQKEQKGIKEVLEQVSQLFADHPDLLMEFTYFLPDAVQEQAKIRLHRAAKESEARRQARLQGLKPPRKGGAGVPGSLGMGGDFGGPAGKRSRAERDGVRPGSGMGQQGGQPYAMQMGVAGMEDSHMQRGVTGSMLGSKRQNVGLGPSGGGGGPSLGANGQPRKTNRRKNASALQQQEDLEGGKGVVGQMGAGGSLSAAARAGKARDSHLSVSAERRFFIQVKEVLGNVSKDAWSEFVKCLELFSGDAITRDDLMELVQDLFGPTNGELFLEFRRLLDSRADYDENKADVWYAVPLSEIDFTQCRKCTPSYRALPQDYPKPKCSERSEEEILVLNDQWVSIPIGSEESYSFKHMRKNQFEEALFKVEDERFEIDMVIDSNMNTIRMLEPLAEEIANFRMVEEQQQQQATRNGHGSSHPIIAPRFSFQLEKRHLSTIHLNAITRIYGEHGEEILELLQKNPAGTIPVLLKRLRQKDTEWRKARLELNKHWKEVVEKNHFKSFDHRSFYFRQQDRKFLNFKQLVGEVTGQPPLPLSQSLIDAADTPSKSDMSTKAIMFKEQTGEWGKSVEDASIVGMLSSIENEVADVLAGMRPQMLLHYPHDAHLVHRDVYRIMCYATEVGSSVPGAPGVSGHGDKERMPALWRDLLRVFFNLPVHYLYNSSPPKASPAPVPTGESTAMDVEGTEKTTTSIPAVVTVDPNEAWPIGTAVCTLYGSGEVRKFRAQDNLYEVQLAFGTAFLRPDVIFGAEQLSVQAFYAIGVTPASEAVIEQKSSESLKSGQDVVFNGLIERDLNPKDRKHGTPYVEDPNKIFFGTQLCYIFFRLHHALFMRLRLAKELCHEAQTANLPPVHHPLYGGSQNLHSNHSSNSNFDQIPRAHSNSVTSYGDEVDHEAGMIYGADKNQPLYNHFLAQVYSLIDGSMDPAKFEEFCRTLLGNKSYVLYTLDKIILQAVKTLQIMASDENVTKLVGLFVYHHNHQTKGGRTGGVDADFYEKHTAHMLSLTLEEVYRFQLITSHVGVTSDGNSQVAVQYLGTAASIVQPGAGGGGVSSDIEEKNTNEDEDVMVKVEAAPSPDQSVSSDFGGKGTKSTVNSKSVENDSINT